MNKTERGHQAAMLLEHPLVKEVLNGLDAEYHKAWREAKTVEAREDLFRYVKVLERVTLDLMLIAQTGQLERARLKELETGKKGLSWPLMK